MRPTEQLIEEHKAIKSMLSILDSVCNKLESKEEINPEDLEQILDFIKTFADKYHHEKEEYLLFPAMEKAGIPREGGPIAVMLMEHNVGRDFVKRMSEAVAKYQDGIHNGSQEIIENARGYISLLTPHIEKEDNILYPMADIHLSENQQAELLEKFEKVEMEKIGLDKLEKLHSLLTRLKAVYLQ